jgi:hypothetical protein
MEVYSSLADRKTTAWSTTNFTEEDYRYWKDYMRHTYPNREIHQYWNSQSVRSGMRRSN